MAGVIVGDWLTFLQNRLEDSNRRIQLVLSLLGILPATSVASLLQIVTNPVNAILVLVAVVALSFWLTYWLLGGILNRRVLLALMELVLGGVLVTPQDVAAAYRVARGYWSPL